MNKSFWLQYFKELDILHTDQTSKTHLIRLSALSAGYAIRHNLVPAQKYIHLLHQDTFIHGPFNFATVNNFITFNCISQQDWQVLPSFSHLFQNPIPSFDVPTYLVHVDKGVHFVFHNKIHAGMLLTQQYLLPHDDTLDSNSSLFSDVNP